MSQYAAALNRTTEEQMIYIVTEEAVYRHRILGVYDSQEKAEARALEVAKKEDGHHRYCVLSAVMNGAMSDPTEVCWYKRERILKTPNLVTMEDYPRRYGEPQRHAP
jgi:hypothetical protein